MGERGGRGGAGKGVVCEISTMMDHRQRDPGKCHISLSPTTLWNICGAPDGSVHTQYMGSSDMYTGLEVLLTCQ